jgi:tRNA dimethylallyltransferase
MQLYRGMTIGTAAPTQEEQCGVPHHMLGVADPREAYSAARYVDEAGACVDDILQRGKLPILVGGTGLYLDSLVAGRSFARGKWGDETRRALQERLVREGAEAMLQELQGIDPTTAARLHPSDEKRILRALEIYYATGQTQTEHDEESRKQPPRYDAVYIGLAFAERADMWALIDRRVDEMMAQGLADEVRALLDAGVPRNSTALQAIGYKEMLSALDGQRTMAEAAEEIKLRTRQYAKRQMTWLRRNKTIHWILWEKERDFSRAEQISTEILLSEGLL